MSRLLLLLAACTSEAPGPTPPGPLGPASAVMAADMDGDGKDELIVVLAGRASWRGHNLTLNGRVLAFTRGDTNGDGKEEVLLATGPGKGFPAAPSRLWKLSSEGPEVLWEKSGKRRITDIRISNGEIYLSAFSGGKTLVGGWLRDGKLTNVTRTQMGLSQIPLNDQRVVVGRLYGDTPRSDGDLRIVEAGAEDRILPTLRGVRALAAADFDQDGQLDLVASDGWHFKYGTHARARLVLYRGPEFKDRRVLADFPDEYTINRIEVVPTPSDSSPKILATGTQKVHLLYMDQLGWQSRVVADTTETDRSIVWSEGPHHFAVVPGNTAQVVALDE